jgi:hypothetical protein
MRLFSPIDQLMTVVSMLADAGLRVGPNDIAGVRHSRDLMGREGVTFVYIENHPVPVTDEMLTTVRAYGLVVWKLNDAAARSRFRARYEYERRLADDAFGVQRRVPAPPEPAVQPDLAWRKGWSFDGAGSPEPCGECHLKPGERCDICGRQAVINGPRWQDAHASPDLAARRHTFMAGDGFVERGCSQEISTNIPALRGYTVDAGDRTVFLSNLVAADMTPQGLRDLREAIRDGNDQMPLQSE